jgi:hypothetical protein
MTHLMYQLAQERIADLHRDAAAARRAALVHSRPRRSWRRALGSLMRPPAAEVSEPTGEAPIAAAPAQRSA